MWASNSSPQQPQGPLGDGGANQLSQLRFDGTLTDLEHKIGHGVLGALQGALLNPHHPLEGMISGAIGGMGSEVFAEGSEHFLGKQMAGNFGILMGSGLALLANQDVDVAGATASNAIANNYWWVPLVEAAPVAITTAKIGWELYALTHVLHPYSRSSFSLEVDQVVFQAPWG